MWVVLVCGILQQKFDKGRIHDLEKTLQEIPKDLHELFRDILIRDDANKDEMLLCIQWVLFARNPLKPEQLYFAIRSQTECTTCKWNRDEITEDTIHNFILNSSKGLAEVIRTKKDPTVQFIHESVRDFLLKDEGLRVILDTSGGIGAESHDQLKRCCYKYARSYTEENGLPESDSKQHLSEACVAADSEFPFLRYAVQNVLYHANGAEEGDISQTEFLKTFQLAEWIQHNNVFQDKDVRRHTIGASLLYLLAEYGFGSLIESHRGSQCCFDVEDERYGAPILAAMATGSRPTVWRLLKRETRDEPATSSLHSLCRDYDVAKIGKYRIGRSFKFNPKMGLLYYMLQDDDLIVASFATVSSKAQTQIDFLPPYGETLLSIAMQHSHDTSTPFKLLLENGMNIEIKDKLGRTPLCLAAANGNTAAVALLLGQGANIEHSCINRKTPLIHAAVHGNEECMRLLISGGASVTAMNHQGQTALFEAVCSRNESQAKVHLLISHGADIAAIDDNGFTALTWYLKMRKAKETIVQMLLDHSGIVDRPDNLGRTPLMFALNNDLSVMKKLIELGADTNSIDYRGQSALLLAVKLKAEGHARLLIDSGACTDVSDTRNNRTALSYAVTSKIYDTEIAPQGNPATEFLYHAEYLPHSIAKALLIQGAAVDKHDINGRTPLSYAASASGSAQKVSVLLSYRADVHRADHSGRTPLSYSIDLGYCVIQQLLSHGANINAADNRGRTPLSYAASSHIFGSEKAVQFLLDRGAIPDKADETGKNAFSYASRQEIRAVLYRYL